MRILKIIASFVISWYITGFLLGFFYAAVSGKTPGGFTLLFLLFVEFEVSIFIAGLVDGRYKEA